MFLLFPKIKYISYSCDDASRWKLMQNKEKIIPSPLIMMLSDHELLLVLYLFDDDCQMGKGGRGEEAIQASSFLLQEVLLLRSFTWGSQALTVAYSLYLIAGFASIILASASLFREWSGLDYADRVGSRNISVSFAVVSAAIWQIHALWKRG